MVYIVLNFSVETTLREKIHDYICFAHSKAALADYRTTFCFFTPIFAACLVQRSGWTKDVDIFLHWLSTIPFAGGGFNDAAIAEGLSEALMVWTLDLLHLFVLLFFVF